MNGVIKIKFSKFIWVANRLRAMGGSEIFWRIRQNAQSKLEKLGYGLVNEVPGVAGKAGKSWISGNPTVDVQSYIQAADKILEGKYDIFSLSSVDIGFPPNWNRDPKTGKITPLQFGKTINYRDESIVGDIKYLWEPNRHLELVTLAQAYQLTSEIRYANAVKTLLESWIEQCPYPLGLNWTSSLEHSVRIVNWSVAWHLLGGEDSLLFKGEEGAVFRQSWLKSVYLHLHFIGNHFSFHSSANNHLLGEYMGLFIGSLTWPLWKECTHWQNVAYKGFLKESLKQNAEDGVNLEQGIWYHHEVADMMLICGLTGKANDCVFPDLYWQRLESMLEFIASIMDVKSNIPMIGDSDDAVMVRFSPSGISVYRSLLATGAVLFERGDFKVKSINFDDKSRWLLGDEGERIFNDLVVPPDKLAFRRAFPDGGYYIFGSKLDSPEEIKLVADAGALGYLSIAAHGHADALAFTLSVRGIEIFIDPGTYAYHTQQKWRDYFRGTSAHNTVCVDNKDQSVSGGNFLWLKHANARCTVFKCNNKEDIWEGEHDGYMRLSDPVKHKRTIVFNKLEEIIVVKDALFARKKHSAELYWHLSEHCNAYILNNAVVIESQDVRVRIKVLNESWHPEIIKGCEAPPLGWISRGFDLKTPTMCIRYVGEIVGTTELSTEIKIEKFV